MFSLKLEQLHIKIKRNKKSKKVASNNAFTLIELLVVMAIFVLITTIVLANHNEFGRRTLLKNLAYNFALAVREAQVSGLTGRNVEITGGEYYASYGIYLNMANPKEYVMFKDSQTAGQTYIYDGNIVEYVKAYKITSPHYKISRLCVVPVVNTNTCNDVSNLHITFKRPEPDAYIYTSNGGPYPAAYVEFSSTDGDKLYVLIESAGQISVQKQMF